MKNCGAIHPMYITPCGKESGHPGAHGYDDGKGGVSWDNNITLENRCFSIVTVRPGTIATCRLPNHHAGPHRDFNERTGELLLEWFNQMESELKTPNFPSVLRYHEKQRRERRERFAMVALDSLLKSGLYPFPNGNGYVVARDAVECADALIAELDKPK